MKNYSFFVSFYALKFHGNKSIPATMATLFSAPIIYRIVVVFMKFRVVGKNDQYFTAKFPEVRS